MTPEKEKNIYALALECRKMRTNPTIGRLQNLERKRELSATVQSKDGD